MNINVSFSLNSKQNPLMNTLLLIHTISITKYIHSQRLLLSETVFLTRITLMLVHNTKGR